MIRKLLKSAMVISLAGSLVGGATFAAWHTTGTVTNNVVNAKTLLVSVGRDNGDSDPGPMFYTTDSQGGPGEITEENATGLWYPGKSIKRNMIIKNTNADIKIALSKIKFILSGIEDNPTDENDAYDEYIDKMNFKVEYFNNNIQLVELTHGKLSEFIGDGKSIYISSSPKIAKNNGTQIYVFTATLDQSAGNIIKGIQPKIDFVVTVNQVQ